MRDRVRLTNKPLYQQVRDALAERFAAHQGEAVPSEEDLAQEYGVSTGTIRRAMSELKAEQVLTRRPGRGSVVNDPCTGELAYRFDNFRSADGLCLTDNVIATPLELGPATPEEQKWLALDPLAKVYRLGRVRRAGDEVYLVEQVALPASVFPNLEEVGDMSSGLMSLAARYRILLGRATEHLAIGGAPADVAHILGVEPGLPLMVMDRVVFERGGRPVEWRHAWFHSKDKGYLATMR
jgi:GntR family transcriptional regulator